MSQITESCGPIPENESNNILKRSLKAASKYFKQNFLDTRRSETITLSIPAELLESGNNMPIDTVELTRQCELYVKKKLEKSFRMSSPDVVEVAVDDDGSIKEESRRDRKKKLRRNDTASSTPTSSPDRSGHKSKNSAHYEKPDPPAQKKGEQQVVRDPFFQARDRCIQNFNDLATRGIQAFDDLASRCYQIFQGLTRRQLMYIAAGLVLFIIIIIVIGVTTGGGSPTVPTTGSGSPAASPIPGQYSGSEEFLRGVLFDMEPIQKDAFHWLLNIDSWKPARDATNIEQLWIERYVLAAFYFSTITSEIKWKNEQNWISDKPVCRWFGVKCYASGEVADLTLSHNEIVGRISTELGKLKSLKRLKLDSNEFEKGIPSEIGGLVELEHLDLYFNMLSGTLPNEIGMLSKLTGLYLRGNQLSGQLPDTFGALTSLTALQISENKFRGPIGSHLASLRNLVTVVIDKNRFSGSLPYGLGKLTKLKWLRIEENEITGSIPISIGYLTALQTVILGNNMITGTLPRDLSGLTKLHQLDVRWNKIEGTIPPGLKRLSNLWHLNLSTNKFDGIVPELPASLTKQDYKNGPFCSLAGNYLADIQNGDLLGCKINGQRS
ncbi:unnamed protein product [Cylindrotheca closterium]|uniref:Disease resistance R13L4/SHOC-2-like LRR domain-containing protein n=1 Tax=Cylindrotheca closterium TaxID=2856 RepID=A0AAD2D026_9STRA|nr:unnamed protein product [Cylindrotheca closterium]